MEEPNAQQRKNLLHVLAYTNIVTAKAREVFYNNGINESNTVRFRNLIL